MLPFTEDLGVVCMGAIVVGFYIFCIMVTVCMKLAQMGTLVRDAPSEDLLDSGATLWTTFHGLV